MSRSNEAWETYQGRPLRFRWSPSAVGDFCKCPWYYHATQVEGWRKPGNLDLLYGSALHDGLWAYYESLSYGEENPLHEAIKTALAAGAGLPISDEDTVKTRPNLVRGLIEWSDSYGVGTPGWLPLLPEASPANEVPFEIDLGMITPNGTPYTLYGILDRVVALKGKPAVLDSKSTKFSMGSFYFDRFRPDTQISLYEGAGTLLFYGYKGKVLIDAFFLSKTQGVNVFRAELEVHDGIEAIEDAKFWIGQAEICATMGVWPRNRTSCSLYGGCVFRKVCAAPAASRQLILEQEYEKKYED